MSEFPGRFLRGVRAGEAKLVWHRPELAGEETIMLSSSTFVAHQPLPRRAAGKGVGENVSPALEWNGVPPSAQQLVLVIEDPDAPTPRPFVHTIVAIIPDLTELAEGVLSAAAAPSGVVFYRGSLGFSGYQGPRPVPGHGPHSYAFELFALSARLGLDASTAIPRTIFAAMAGRVIARGRLDGTYER